MDSHPHQLENSMCQGDPATHKHLHPMSISGHSRELRLCVLSHKRPPWLLVIWELWSVLAWAGMGSRLRPWALPRCQGDRVGRSHPLPRSKGDHHRKGRLCGHLRRRSRLPWCCRVTRLLSGSVGRDILRCLWVNLSWRKDLVGHMHYMSVNNGREVPSTPREDVSFDINGYSMAITTGNLVDSFQS
jgi:hypothetical protein